MDRIEKLDAIKGIAIVMVVFGHFIESYANSNEFLKYLYGLIYAVHIPAFAMAAGVVAKATMSWNELKKIARRILLPFIVFNLMYVGFGYAQSGRFTYSTFTPYWLMWFLLSLTCWRILLPLFASKIGLGTSVAIALAAGWFQSIGYPLTLSRTLYFLPFFVFGHLYGSMLLSTIPKPRTVTSIAAIGLACAGAVIILITSGTPLKLFYGSLPYAAGNEIFGTAMRAMLLSLSFGLVLTLTTIPIHFGHLLRHFGLHSLAIYLGHGFIVLAMRKYMFFTGGTLKLIACSTAATLVTLLVCCLLTPALNYLTGVGNKISSKPYTA
jgi:Fucose 4-O-acetylase and related acetyltransferases